MSAGAKAILTKRFRAPVEEVFIACSDPALLARWLGPNAFVMERVEADVCVGGRFWFRMSKDGEHYAAEGFYEIVDPPQRLSLSWKWIEGPSHEPPDGIVSRVTFDFARDGAGTLLTLTHEGLSDRAQADNHAQGWSEGLAKLERFLEKSR